MKRSGPSMCAESGGELRARRSCKRTSKSLVDELAQPRTQAHEEAKATTRASGVELEAASLIENSIGVVGRRRRQLASPSPVHQSNKTEESNHNTTCSDMTDEYYDADFIKSLARVHYWHWNRHDKSPACEVGKDPLEVCFHPECSESAAAIRANEPLTRNGNFYYWEVKVYDKTYGTSVMFGLCTKRQKLHHIEYCNLVGLDTEGWSLNHKGLTWHGNKHTEFTQPFPINQPVTVGLLYNTMRGELSYFLDGKNLGIAFYGLNKVTDDLYPVIGSTAKCTRIKLIGSYCGHLSLQTRAGFTLLKHAPDSVKLVNQLHLLRVPKNLVDFLLGIVPVRADGTGTQKNNSTHQQNNDKQTQQLERQHLNPLKQRRLNDDTTPNHHSRIGRKWWKWNCSRSP